MKHWIVVANGSRARVLEASGAVGAATAPFVHVADLVHPASRSKGSELASDAPGRVAGSGHGLGSAKLVPRTGPREREVDRFAQQLARLLDDGVADGRCAGIVLVASAALLGELKSHLGEQARKVVRRTLVADYTSLDERSLAARLGARAASPAEGE